jgi:hypothetical protein
MEVTKNPEQRLLRFLVKEKPNEHRQNSPQILLIFFQSTKQKDNYNKKLNAVSLSYRKKKKEKKIEVQLKNAKEAIKERETVLFFTHTKKNKWVSFCRVAAVTVCFSLLVRLSRFVVVGVSLV